MNGPNGAGDRSVSGVFARVRRDRQVSNLLYGLLGAEDERDPEGALASLATSAAATLDVCGPEYRVRVIRALQLLTGLVLDAAEHAPSPTLVAAHEQLTSANSDDDGAPDGPHPFVPQTIAGLTTNTCQTCGEPSGAVEHFTPTGVLNAPAVVALDLAPADVHPVTGHRLEADFGQYHPTLIANPPGDDGRPIAGGSCPVCGSTDDDHRDGPHQAAAALIPCPTCGVLPPQHTPACADQDAG